MQQATVGHPGAVTSPHLRRSDITVRRLRLEDLALHRAGGEERT